MCRGGEYHRLHVQFRPPDDGPVRPETCRGKRIADVVRRREKQCIKLEIKKNKLRNSTCFRQFLCPSSGVFHCTHSNGICHTGLLTAC